MHIESIEIKNYKSIKNSFTTFSPKINIIVGLNGSGKSNLISAFKLIFTPKSMYTHEKQSLINEGNALTNKQCSISVKFVDNDRFLFSKMFSLVRVFDFKKDDFYVLQWKNLNHNKYNCDEITDKKNITDMYLNNENIDITDLNKENYKNTVIKTENLIHKQQNYIKNVLDTDEYRGILESTNLSDTNFFIIEQGKINKLSNLSDIERYILIKEVAGVKIYERDRKISIKLLKESDNNQKRIKEMISKVENKLKYLDKECKKIKECEELEKMKYDIEISLIYREKEENEERIQFLYSLDSDKSKKFINHEDLQEVKLNDSISIDQCNSQSTDNEEDKINNYKDLDTLKKEIISLCSILLLDFNVSYDSFIQKNICDFESLNKNNFLNLDFTNPKLKIFLIKSIENYKFNVDPKEDVSNVELSNKIHINKQKMFVERTVNNRDLILFILDKIKEFENIKIEKIKKKSEDEKKDRNILENKIHILKESAEELQKEVNINKLLLDNLRILISKNNINFEKEIETIQTKLKQNESEYEAFCKTKNALKKENQSVNELKNSSEVTNKNNSSPNFSNIAKKYSNINLSSKQVMQRMEDIVNQRNKLNRQYKIYKDKIQEINKEITSNERKLLLHNNIDARSYDIIKNHKGVHGFVFELFSVDDELCLAFETVTKKNLFDIVVSNEDVATELISIINCRATFIPLNRIENSDKNINTQNILKTLSFNSIAGETNNSKNTKKSNDNNNIAASFGSTLNALSIVSSSRKSIENTILLSDQIKCDPEYKKLLPSITKNSFIVSDIKYGILISKSQNINVVTIDGDFVSKKGTISGGFEKRKSVFTEIRRLKIELSKGNARLNSINNMILELEYEMDIIKRVQDSDSNTVNDNYLNSMRNLIVFMMRYLDILRQLKDIKVDNNSISNNKENANQIFQNGISSVSTIIYQKIIQKNIDKISKSNTNKNLQFLNLEKEIKKLEYDLEKAKIKSHSYDSIIKQLENEIKNLDMASQFMNLLCIYSHNVFNQDQYKKKEGLNEMKDININDVSNEKLKLERMFLIQKNQEIINKIGNHKENLLYTNKSKNELTQLLKEINAKLRKYIGLNKTASTDFIKIYNNKELLKQRINELTQSKQKIIEFISELNSKKNDAINLTFDMIKSNFEFFYRKLTDNRCEMKLKDCSVQIILNNQPLKTNRLSTGQKTIIALSLIFSIQKIDPSPFYFFDEIDANLDRSSRIKLANLLNELSKNTQYFIASFREEMLECGEKFIGVQFSTEGSQVKEIDFSKAKEYVVFDTSE
ncbi:hypothetical protein EDEG_01812 [Edhazardia aedis USNM 41457]|uniref:SMC hinge domain-containing protein n=1 Tax=Edhazardia aedis (strain USNM 41457) TaxID=1003232 RepID=J9DRD6_EDHAE|nr:hypothetical protein EDEG_01812 [Edhazardia aedis USNM 41457]|eukprot:EJW03902.1 hypothetical protein EDEG_01812 [Edhazardia aedis USNM 41457]